MEDGTVINDFPGLIDNIDPRDIPPGSADVQTNAACVKMGELQVRLGVRDVTFEADV
jgi:hypothetical protein